MRMNMKYFKKVHTDEASTTFQHKDGHQMKVLHKALSPDMRKEITAMPLAEGGEVPETHEDKMAALQAGATKKPVAKKESTPGVTSSRALTTPSAPNAKDEAYKSEVQKFNSQMNQPGMADGGEVKDIDYQKMPEQAPQALAAAPQQAPVVINVGGGGAQPAPPPAEQPDVPMAQKIGHYIGQGGRAVADQMINNPSNPVGGMIQGAKMGYSALQGALQGGTGQPLAPIPDANQPSAGGPAPGSAPQLPSIAPQTPPQAPQDSDPYGTNAYSDAYMKGLQEQKSGLQGQAAATGVQGQQEAAALQKSQDSKQQLMTHFQDSYNELDKERQATLQDYKNQHIDPNHFWSNRSTVGKIDTVIGMILGGVGGGSNSGVDMLNRQIDRDIDGQKANLGKTENLLNANMKQFGNLRDASDMTRLMQMDIAKDQLAQAASNAKGPLEKARALQAIGALDQAAAPIQQQIAMRKTIMKGASSGSIDPEKAVEWMLPDHAKPEARKELKEARDTVAFKDNLLSAFDQLTKLTTLGSKVKSPFANGEKIDALKGPLTAALSKGTAGKFTEQDAHMLDALWPSLKDNDSSLAVKRTQLIKLIQEKMHFPVLKGNYGLDQSVMNSGRYDMEGQPRGVTFTPGVSK